MKLTIQAIHFTAADKLKNYIEKKSAKLDQFFDRIVESTVRLKLEPEVSGANKLVEIHEAFLETYWSRGYRPSLLKLQLI